MWCDGGERDLALYTCSQVVLRSRLESDGLLPVSRVQGKSFALLPAEVADTSRQADKNPNKRIVGDTTKLKANIFYGKMIEDVVRHENTIFTSDENNVYKAMRSPYLEDLEENGNAHEIREGKHKVSVVSMWDFSVPVG